MKRMLTIAAALFMALGLAQAQSQVVDVCAGNDTVVLRLGNFQHGYVQWQVSDDNETWSDIDGAIDTIYKFLPDRPLYYRAEVRFPACSQYNYHSQVSYVQIPPKANAGPDITIPARMVTRMNAVNVVDSQGEWNIIEGPNGQIDNSSDPRSLFFGEEGDYKLTWTVTNSCGSDTDTVIIKCIHLEYQSDVVYVDETDAVLSDSSQITNGEYIIVFSDPVPEIHVGTILLGYCEPSFLRKVVEMERNGNLFVLKTEQGQLTDLMLSGALYIDPVPALEGRQQRGVKYIDRYPTRKEMMDDPFLLRDGNIYVIENNADMSGERLDGVELTAEYDNEDGSLELGWKVDMGTWHQSMDGIIYEETYKLDPNIRGNISFPDGHLTECYLGMYNASFEHTVSLSADKPVSTAEIGHKGTFNKSPIVVARFVIGTVPTKMTIDFPYNIKAAIAINGLKLSFTKTTNFTCAIEYDTQTHEFNKIFDKHEVEERPGEFDINGTFDVKFNAGAKLSMLMAGSLGPYIEVRGIINPSVCTSLLPPYYINADLNLGVDLDVGWRFHLIKDLIEADVSKTFHLIDFTEQAPKRVKKYQGDNQVYTFGNYLPIPITVDVEGWFGIKQPLAQVYFEPETGGEVTESVVATDLLGRASTLWKPNSPNGRDKLRVKVYDCHGDLIAGTPVVFQAYSSATDPCINSNLTVEAYHVQENRIIPQVHGGRSPYLYSTDGESFSSVIPNVQTQPGHNYTFYVQDANHCEAMTTYNEPFYDCENSGLTVSVTALGNVIHATGYFGIEPYWYSIDGINYQPTGLFGVQLDGEYTVYVRDALGCVDTEHITVSREGNLYVWISEINGHSGTAEVMVSLNGLADRGICWSTHREPTVEDFHASFGPGTGPFPFNITGLDSETTYYVRAYALDPSGTSYSEERCIHPSAGFQLPTVASTGITNVSETTALGSGNVTYDGGSPVVEHGICWGTNHNPTIAGSHLACGSGTGAFTGEITGLTPNMTYYARAYATNSVGTAYGLEVEYYTGDNGGGNIPQVITTEITDITSTTATCWFQVLSGLPIQGSGVCYSTHPLPTVDDYMATLLQSGDYVGYLSGLMPNTTYYVRAYAFNVNMNFCYGNELSFTTLSGGGDNLPEGAINGLFSVGDGQQVYFSQGNLQYQASTNTWRFAENQWDCVGEGNSNISPTYSGFIDLFNWGTSGYNKGAMCYQPWSTSTEDDAYWAYGNMSNDLFHQTGQADWGFNPIINGGNASEIWRTLSEDEWIFLLHYRNTKIGLRYAKATVNGVKGLVLFPDDWDNTEITIDYPNSNHDSGYNYNTFNEIEWQLFQEGGVVFLPTAGFRCGYIIDELGEHGYYWTSKRSARNEAWVLSFNSSVTTNQRSNGFSVRLVQDFPSNIQHLPVVITMDIENVTVSSAICSGNMLSTGSDIVYERGICWSLDHNPTIRDYYRCADSGNGVFTVNMNNLHDNTTYYVRAYAKNSYGVAYGQEKELTTVSIGEINESIPIGAVSGLYSVSEGKKVWFSKGNLQFRASTNTWKFAENQWDYIGSQFPYYGYDEPGGTVVGSDNIHISQNYDGWIDLFGWGTSGNNHGAVCYQPWSVDEHDANYYAYGLSIYDLDEQTRRADWGYNSISNAGNWIDSWRVLSCNEWDFLLLYRLTNSNIRYAFSQVNGVNGMLLFPDNWNINYFSIFNANAEFGNFSDNLINESQWYELEQYGVVFLPATGYRRYEDGNIKICDLNEIGFYWTTEAKKVLHISGYFEGTGVGAARNDGMGVRLVHDAETNPPFGQLPQVTTSEVSEFYNNSAICGGNVISDGGLPVSERGICWSTGHNPTISGNHVTAGSGTGSFTVNATGIVEGVTYYARAYAINSVGIAYGNEVEFIRNQGGGGGGGTGGGCPEGGIDGLFTINGAGDMVYFSQGNLQYQASTNTWRFAENQWDCVGEDNNNISPTYDGWIDLFGWGTSGYNHGAVSYQPWSTSMDASEYFAYGNADYNLFDQTRQADWGYNRISNGGDTENQWRTLTKSEWDYILNTRNTTSGIRYALAKVNGVNGLILISDLWQSSNYPLSNPNTMDCVFENNVIDADTWEHHFELAGGCVFLSAAGVRYYGVSNVGNHGMYWSSNNSSNWGDQYASYLDFASWGEPYPMTHSSNRECGYAVRLVYSAGSGSGNGGGGRKK